MRCLQKFAAVHAAVYNHFNQERALYTRANFKANGAAALSEWRQRGVAQSAALLSLQRLVRIGLTAPEPDLWTILVATRLGLFLVLIDAFPAVRFFSHGQPFTARSAAAAARW
jgi:putative transposase